MLRKVQRRNVGGEKEQKRPEGITVHAVAGPIHKVGFLHKERQPPQKGGYERISSRSVGR